MIGTLRSHGEDNAPDLAVKRIEENLCLLVANDALADKDGETVSATTESFFPPSFSLLFYSIGNAVEEPKRRKALMRSALQNYVYFNSMRIESKLSCAILHIFL